MNNYNQLLYLANQADAAKKLSDANPSAVAIQTASASILKDAVAQVRDFY
ncbi:hypothetical protein LGK98_00515 [Clostridium tagluense]|nr:hypothetical protein [Clostridium tagluense]MCB2319296.1 hypothetical protein [Clostridium tagluense]MCB2334321.1 hypothetical protein [Clostridium tagluense]